MKCKNQLSNFNWLESNGSNWCNWRTWFLAWSKNKLYVIWPSVLFSASYAWEDIKHYQLTTSDKGSNYNEQPEECGGKQTIYASKALPEIGYSLISLLPLQNSLIDNKQVSARGRRFVSHSKQDTATKQWQNAIKHNIGMQSSVLFCKNSIFSDSLLE